MRRVRATSRILTAAPSRGRVVITSIVLVCACKPSGEATEPASTQSVEVGETGELAGAQSPTLLTTAALQAIVDAPDREEADREADLRRQPVDLLAFIGLAPGMRVADIGAGFGYMTELLARSVGPEGTVYGQNSPFVLDRFAREGWNARLAKPINQGVLSLERPFDDPFPDEVGDLDRVVNVLFYHDFEWMGVDRAAHVADVFAALR
ncbi:MAG: hypothetical protein KC457_15435, partial [Myxococcales bacterium]|nr:hypothetical protein [Myxococcales bacterium]